MTRDQLVRQIANWLEAGAKARNKVKSNHRDWIVSCRMLIRQGLIEAKESVGEPDDPQDETHPVNLMASLLASFDECVRASKEEN